MLYPSRAETASSASTTNAASCTPPRYTSTAPHCSGLPTDYAILSDALPRAYLLLEYAMPVVMHGIAVRYHSSNGSRLQQQVNSAPETTTRWTDSTTTSATHHRTFQTSYRYSVSGSFNTLNLKFHPFPFGMLDFVSPPNEIS